LKKFDVEVEKIDEGPYSNIHQKSNVTTIKSIIDKENDVDRRRNTMQNVKLNEDEILWKKEKSKNYKQKRS